jgi:hypothetical protein
MAEVGQLGIFEQGTLNTLLEGLQYVCQNIGGASMAPRSARFGVRSWKSSNVGQSLDG